MEHKAQAHAKLKQNGQEHIPRAHHVAPLVPPASVGDSSSTVGGGETTKVGRAKKKRKSSSSGPATGTPTTSSNDGPSHSSPSEKKSQANPHTPTQSARSARPIPGLAIAQLSSENKDHASTSRTGSNSNDDLPTLPYPQGTAMKPVPPAVKPVPPEFSAGLGSSRATASGLPQSSTTSSRSPTSNNSNVSFSSINSSFGPFYKRQNIDQLADAFVSDFTYLSVISQEEANPTYEPTSADVALMFIDMSGYSQLAQKLAAYDLAAVVNLYFSKILKVVHECGGDVLKFLGDAIMVVWVAVNREQSQRTHQPARTLETCCQDAVTCAHVLQERCMTCQYEDLTLQLHIGISAGALEGSVLSPPLKGATSHSGSAEAYHFIGGKALQGIDTYIDGAPSGEVCVSKKVLELSTASAELVINSTAVEGTKGEAHIIRLNVSETAKTQGRKSSRPPEDREDPFLDPLEALSIRTAEVDKKFIFPSAIASINMGIPLDQIESHRNLYVLFIKKVIKSVPVHPWFAEVSEILDKHRCPITQVIDDDKGIHIVAALNLFVNEPNAADVAVNLVAELVNRRTGCIIGVANGMVLCGIQGNARSCRYDITGAAVVRACRLMQYADQFWDEEGEPKQQSGANSNKEEKEEDQTPQVVLDLSVAMTLKVKSMVKMLGMAKIKGSEDEVPLFTLSYLAFRGADALSCIAGATEITTCVHAAHRRRVHEIAKGREATCLTVLSGPLNVGKSSIVISTLQELPPEDKFASFLHLCTRGGQPYDLLRTMASWFSYHSHPALRQIAGDLKTAVASNQQVATVRLGIKLIRASFAANLRIAITVQKAHHIDADSLRFLTGAINATSADGPQLQSSAGRWLWFLCSTPMEGGTRCEIAAKQIPAHLFDHLQVERLPQHDAMQICRDYNRGNVRAVTLEHWAVFEGMLTHIADGSPKQMKSTFHKQVMETWAPAAEANGNDDNIILMPNGRILFSPKYVVKWSQTGVDESQNLPYEQAACEMADTLPVMQRMLLTVMAVLCLGQASRTEELWFPAPVVCRAVLSFFSMTSSTVEDLEKDVMRLKQNLLLNTKKFPLQEFKDLRSGERRAETSERSGVVIRHWQGTPPQEVESVLLINMPSRMMAATLLKTMTPQHAKFCAQVVTLYYFTSVEWQDALSLSDYIAAANIWTKLGKDKKKAARFLLQAVDQYTKSVVKEGPSLTRSDDQDTFFYHHVAFHLHRTLVDCDLGELLPSDRRPQVYPLADGKPDPEKGYVHFSKDHFYLNTIEPPLVLGPLAGVMQHAAWRLQAHTFNLNDDRLLTKDYYGSNSTTGAALGFHDPLQLPETDKGTFLTLMQRFDKHVSGDPPMPWEEESKIIHRIFELYSDQRESEERVSEAAQYLQASISNRTERLAKYVNTPESAVWAVLETERVIESNGTVPTKGSDESSVALMIRTGLWKAFGHIRDVTVPDLENSDEKKSELTRPKVQLAMRDCLMELSASNWSTSYYYQNPAALRDLWLVGDIDALDVKGLIFCYMLSMPEDTG